MRNIYHSINSNLKENKEDWYYLCNDAEQALFKVKEQCKDEAAIKSLERMIIDLNSIRMEQYEALVEYALVESPEIKVGDTITFYSNGYKDNGKFSNKKDILMTSKVTKVNPDGSVSCTDPQGVKSFDYISKDEILTVNGNKLNEEFWNEAGEKEYKGITISIEKGDHGNTCYIPLRNKELNFIPEPRTQFFSYSEVKKYIDDKLKENKLDETFKGTFEGKEIKVNLHNDKDNPVWIIGDISINDNKYRVNAKVYLEGSEFGIEEGPISKLYIADSNGDCVINYDRGWDIKPTEETEEIYNITLGAVRSYRNSHPYEPDPEPEIVNEAVDPNEEVISKLLNYINNEYNEIGTDDKYFLISKLKGRGSAKNKVKAFFNYIWNEYNELGSDDKYFMTNIAKDVIDQEDTKEEKPEVKEEPKERKPAGPTKKQQVLEKFNSCLNGISVYSGTGGGGSAIRFVADNARVGIKAQMQSKNLEGDKFALSFNNTTAAKFQNRLDPLYLIAKDRYDVNLGASFGDDFHFYVYELDQIEEMSKIIEEILLPNGINESAQMFTDEEREEYYLDEEGIDELGEQWIHCEWCGEIVPLSDCKKELNLGWICKDCQNALYSRGEHPVYDENADFYEETINESVNKDSSPIEYATPCYTGGGVYVYTGKLKDGNYFLGSDDWFSKENNYFTFRIVNEDPDKFPDDCFFDDWQQEHLVKDLSLEENKKFTKQALNWVIKNKPEGNYQVSDMEDLLDIVNK